jgi:hypothetical protein
MKRIIKNYIVRDPNALIKNIGRNYNTYLFSPIENGQTYFEDLTQFDEIENINSTELYINGIRYNPNIDYNLGKGNILHWLANNHELDTTDNLVFVWR